MRQLELQERVMSMQEEAILSPLKTTSSSTDPPPAEGEGGDADDSAPLMQQILENPTRAAHAASKLLHR